MKYPGIVPGKSSATVADDCAVLENEVLRCEWTFAANRVAGVSFQNRHTEQVISFDSGYLSRISIGDGLVIDLAAVLTASSLSSDGNTVTAVHSDEASQLEIQWSATLDDDSNAMIQSLKLTASRDTAINELVFVDTVLGSARQVGEVAGSVVVCGDIFLAVEHPLAGNTVGQASNVKCSLPLSGELEAGQSLTHTFVIGVTPPGQLRRGFLYYMERRRIYPYRQFLHYNNWYDVWLGRPVERIKESECLDAIEYFGRELVEKRNVKMDAVVWDDGWDDFNTLWDFHRGFPDGFRNLDAAAREYGISQGVWMSPNGGYATAKEKRIEYGKPLGYETNDNGFAMGGPNYYRAFREACLKMMRENGVVFFKFDGMGEGGSGSGHTGGASVGLSNDIQAVLELSRDLHRERPDVYISATCGTWASPFWLLYADSIWRQGGDSGHHGEGDTRQQWITYRDKFCYERVAQAGPLYPHNSLMLHGILIGNRKNRAPAGMLFDEKSIADEIWTFFASGTCLQELYITPGLMTDSMLDELARAAKWARSNADTLIDTHWVGGNPGEGEVYGRASWQPGKGILVLRNPSGKAQDFSITPETAFELPEGVRNPVTLQAVYDRGRQLVSGPLEATQQIEIRLEPFEVVVMEAINNP